MKIVLETGYHNTSFGRIKMSIIDLKKSLATHWMYLACSLFVGFVGHSICRICSPKNWTKKITNIPVFHQWLRTKHTFFCQYKHNQGRRQIFSKRGGQGKHAIFNGNPCIFLKFLRPGGGKFCSHLAFRFPRGGLYTILGCWGYSDPPAPLMPKWLNIRKYSHSMKKYMIYYLK